MKSTLPGYLSALLIGTSLSLSAAELVPDPAFECRSCDGWNQPQRPFQIYGNTYYVGTAGLAAILVATEDAQGEPALILIDAGLTQSALPIAQNIRELGFELEQIKIMLNSHPHFDHAGGMNALQRASGAQVVVSEGALSALQTGRVPAHDPQAGYAPYNDFPPVANVRAVGDETQLTLGSVTVTLHLTPGHTPGGSSWSWRSCVGHSCRTMVYADSLNPVSAPGFKFSAPLAALHGGSTEAQLRHSAERLRRLDCDVLLTPHPAQFQLQAKLAQREADPESDPFYNPLACQEAAHDAELKLQARLAEERSD